MWQIFKENGEMMIFISQMHNFSVIISSTYLAALAKCPDSPKEVCLNFMLLNVTYSFPFFLDQRDSFLSGTVYQGMDGTHFSDRYPGDAVSDYYNRALYRISEENAWFWLIKISFASGISEFRHFSCHIAAKKRKTDADWSRSHLHLEPRNFGFHDFFCHNAAESSPASCKWWREPEYLAKTTAVHQVTGNFLTCPVQVWSVYIVWRICTFLLNKAIFW